MEPVDEPSVVSVDAGMASDSTSNAAPDDPIFDSVIIPIMEVELYRVPWRCGFVKAQRHVFGGPPRGGTKAGPAIVPCDASRRR